MTITLYLEDRADGFHGHIIGLHLLIPLRLAGIHSRSTSSITKTEYFLYKDAFIGGEIDALNATTFLVDSPTLGTTDFLAFNSKSNKSSAEGMR